MSTSAKVFPAKSANSVRAKITSKGQITIPAEIRRSLGAKAGDVLLFERTPDGVKIVRQVEDNPFERMRGIGNGIPELDGSVESIVKYMRELRGHDEYDDQIFGTER